MAVEAKDFSVFGVEYRTTQFTAGKVVKIRDADGSFASPLIVLGQTYARRGEDWIRLDNRRAVNEMVRDVTGIIVPTSVLKGVLHIVQNFNFGFEEDWRGVKVPSRFTSDFKTRQSQHMDSLLATLIQSGTATLRELEEYYSWEDAHAMLDVITAKTLNEALSNEAAMSRR